MLCKELVPQLEQFTTIAGYQIVAYTPCTSYDRGKEYSSPVRALTGGIHFHSSGEKSSAL